MRVPKTFLNKFDIITREGATELVSLVTVTDSLLQGEDDKQRYFVPLRAIRGELYDELLEILSETDDDYIDIEELYPYFHSGVIWAEKVVNKQDLPVKGEKVVATFEENDAGELVCSGIVMIGKFRSSRFNFDRAIYNKKNKKHE